jgi:ABC-type transport system involved in multi-copper enzyme maturation permease subunit
MWRDWVLNRPALMPALLVYAVFQLAFVPITAEVPLLPLVAGCFWVCVLTMVAFAREHQSRAIAWACTLPVERAELIKARYLASWVLVAGALLLVFVVSVLVPGSPAFLAPNINLDTPLAAAAVMTVFIALVFPPVARFGPKGAAFLLIGLNVLLPLVFVVSKVTGTQDNVEEVVIGAALTLAARVGQVKAAMPTPVFYAAVFVLLLFLNWFSYRVAAALFRGREF